MKKLFQTAALALLVGALAALAPSGDALHFALSKSAPEADATVQAPSELRLWFTEEPEEGTTSIRLVEAEEVGVPVTEAKQDEDDPTSFFVEVGGALPPGTYTVSWRGMGDDGHVVRDSFEFTVVAH